AAGEALDAGLARGVGPELRPHRAAGRIGNVDDDAALLLRHVGDDLAADQVRAGQICLDHVPPQLERVLGDREPGSADRGCVHDDVDSAEAVPDPVDHAHHGILDADVASHGQYCPTPLPTRSLERLQVRGPPGTECDARTALGEAFHEAAAQPA